jgi:EmrB/QacA subfamily drug resistance transporter
VAPRAGLRALTAVLSLGSFLVVLDTTVVNVALETLGRRLEAPLDVTQWVVIAYLLALAVVIPLTGWASHRVGARRLWLTAVGLFVAGSALCAAAPSVEALIGARVVQGLGGGMIPPLGQAIVVGAAGSRPLGRVMSALNLPLLAGPVLGPAFGGALLDGFGWRAIFLVNLPLGLLALALGARLLPRAAPDRRQRLDVRGALLLSSGMALFVLGVVRAGSSGLGSPATVGAVLAGALLIAAFVAHARGFPGLALLDVRLLGRRPFAAAAMAAFIFQFVHAGVLAILPLYFQIVRGESAFEAGLLVGVQGVGSVVALSLAGGLADRFGPARIARAGTAIALLATLPFTWLTDATPYPLLVAVLVVRGFGISATITPIYAAAYERLPKLSVPRATTALNVVTRVGAALAVGVLLLVLERELGDGAAPPTQAEAFATTFSVVAGCAAVAVVLAWRIPARGSVPARAVDLGEQRVAGEEAREVLADAHREVR